MHQNSDDLSATDPTWGLNPDTSDLPTVDPFPIPPPPPQDPISPAWAEVENRHFSGTALCPLGELVVSYDDSLTLMENRVYPIYTAPAASPEELTAIFAPLTSPESSLRFRDQLAMDQTTFGVLFAGEDLKEAEYSGWALYEKTTGRWYIDSGFSLLGSYETGIPSDEHYHRSSLVMTASLVGKLEAVGFRPETTNSLHFSMVPARGQNAITGILFYDDAREYVLPTSMINQLNYQDFIYYDPDGNLLTVTEFANIITDNSVRFFPRPLAPGENPDT